MKWVISSILFVLLIIAITLKTRDRQDDAALPPPQIQEEEDIPDFGSYQNVRQKKQAFFEFLLPMVRNANTRILAERSLIEAASVKLAAGSKLSRKESTTLHALFDKYHVETMEASTRQDIERLLLRADVVPASLVLAQSANESAWGTSRFATKGNNFFGIWCFEPGCGFAPFDRQEGLSHEVARFPSVQHSVDYYLKTINTHPAYRDLRQIRAHQRKQNVNIRGMALAEGLRRYSERGQDYIHEIQAMIRINNLQQYTLDTAGP